MDYSQYCISPDKAGRHFGDNERKFLSHIHPDEIFLHDAGLSLREGEHHRDYPAAVARSGFCPHGGQQEIALELFRQFGIDSRVAHDEVIERPMFACSSSVIRYRRHHSGFGSNSLNYFFDSYRYDQMTLAFFSVQS